MIGKLIKSVYTVIVASLLFGSAIYAYASANKAEANENALPDEITLDYANWNLISLVIHEKGLLDEEFKGDDVKINWVFSPGGNKGMEYLLSGSADIAVSAEVPPLLSSINGNPITSVYVVYVGQYAILASPESGIKDLQGLKGKNTAVTLSTAPHTFLIKALDLAGIDIKELNLIPLQQADGKSMLLQGKVDAFVGGAVNWTLAEIGGGKVIYRNPDLIDYNVLNVRNEFLRQYPVAVYRVLLTYEKAKKWARDNPDEFVDLVVKRTKVSPEVARPMIQIYDFTVNGITDKAIDALIKTGQLLQKTGSLKKDIDVESAVRKLYDKKFYEGYSIWKQKQI